MRELIIALLKTGSGTIVGLAIRAVTMKIISVFAGPAGVGMFSILRQIQQSAITVGTCNGGVSLVRGVSGLRGREQTMYIKTTAVIYLAFGIVVGSSLLLMSHIIAKWFGIAHPELIMLLALPVLAGILRDYLNSMLNGFHAIGRLSTVQVFAAMAGLLVAYPVSLLASHGHYGGFVLYLLITASVSVVSLLYFLKGGKWMPDLKVSPYWNRPGVKYFFRMAGAMLLTGTAGALSLAAVRGLISSRMGMAFAGFFDVNWTLSNLYIGLFLSSFATYYLPKLSAISDTEKIDLVKRVGRLTTCIIVPLLVFIICVKPWIILVFYTRKFMPSIEMFRWMLIAGYLQVTAWIFSIITIAKGMEKPFIIGSIGWDAGFLAGTWAAMRFKLGLGAVGLSMALFYGLSLLFNYFVISKAISFKVPVRLLFNWILGLLLIVAASIAQWKSYNVNLIFTLVFTSAALLMSWTCLEPDDKKGLYKIISKRGDSSVRF
ncbi:MAG: oligosaccharide flippase family protein [Nitrospiraceae bacterium]|nr:oligosaccharide flippase family protein [Nitrospiraceae bacterium]